MHLKHFSISLLALLLACNVSNDQLQKRAAELFDQENYEQAKATLDSAIALGGTNYQLYFMRGSCHFNLKNYKEAIRDYELAKESSKDPEIYYYLGSARFYSNEFDKAIDDFTMAITLKQDYAEAFALRGDTWLSIGSVDSALADLNKSLELNNKLSGTHFSLGNYYAANSHYDQALAYYSQAIELEPKPDYLYNRGVIYYYENDFINALNDLTYTITLDDSYAEAYVIRGNIKDEMGNSIEALQDFDKAISLSPENGFAHFNRGITRKNLGDSKGACEDFNRALELGYTEAIAKTGDCPS